MPTISVTNKCQNHCLMCTNTRDFLSEKNQFRSRFILKRIHDFSRGNSVFVEKFSDAFYLSGGEPTLSQNFFTIAKEIRAYFPFSKVICLTNGRSFCDKSYAMNFFKTDLITDIAISVLGPNDDIHDKITGVKGSFAETIAGIENIYRFKNNSTGIQVRIIVTGLNYQHIGETLNMLNKHFKNKIKNVIIIFLEIEGMALKNFKKVKLSYKKAVPYLNRIKPLFKKNSDFRLYHFPLCILPQGLYSFAWRTLESDDVKFLSLCKKCSLSRFCLGIPKGYLKYFGESEFKAVSRQIDIIPSNNWYHPISNVRNAL